MRIDNLITTCGTNFRRCSCEAGNNTKRSSSCRGQVDRLLSLPLPWMLHVSLGLLLLLAPAFLPSVAAQSEQPADQVSDNQEQNGSLDLKTEKVIVFKDGYALVIKRGKGRTDAKGELHTTEVPDAAVLGTFWAIPDSGRLKMMHSGFDESSTESRVQIPCKQTLDVLQANIGRECEVEMDDKSVHIGTIQEVLGQKVEVPFNEDMLSGPDASLSSRLSTNENREPAATKTMIQLQGSHFLLRRSTGDVLLSIAGVRKLSIDKMATTVERTVREKRKEKRLTFTFDESDVEREMLLMYFRPGIRWIPTYRLDLASDGENAGNGHLSLQAELLNEAEDLQDVTMDIVVGVPNFRFRSLPSPMILEQTLRNALIESAPQLMGQGGNFAMNSIVSNQLMSQRSGERFRPSNDSGNGGEGGQIDLPAELTTAASQELFVYGLGEVSLDRHGRAAVPIVSADVAYDNIYTWDLQLKRGVDQQAVSSSEADSPLQLTKNSVWRQLELRNETELPWTTGSAMIMDGRQPLAQELLTYTPPGDICRIPVTVAVDLRGTYSEREVDRTINALKWGSYNYTQIVQEMQLKLVNRKREKVDVEITLRLGGKVDSASNDGQVEVAAYRAEDWSRYIGDPAVNNSSIVVWRTSLGPGESFEPTVKYHFFARQ